MRYRKFETTYQPQSGATHVRGLGCIASEVLDSDIQIEMERNRRIALGYSTESNAPAILTVEQTETNIVVIYTNGKVRITQYSKEA